MPLEISFEKVWLAAGQTSTVSVREIGTCFDSALPSMVLGDGATAAALALANSASPAEDDSTPPLHLVRVLVPPSLGPVVYAAISSAMVSCAAQFVSTAVPPTPLEAAAYFVAASSAILVRNPFLDAAVGAYLSTAWVGGV